MPADAKTSPPALPPPDQNSDQTASIEISEDGESLYVFCPTPDSGARLMAAFGTKDRDFFNGLVSQIGRAHSPETSHWGQTTSFLLSVVKNAQPRDELEAMLLAQMATCHKILMDTTRRLNSPEDYRLLVKLMKTYADLKQTFDRGRRASEQSFMVQNMTVKDGGQAIVGNVSQTTTVPNEGKTAASPPPPSEACGVPLARITESPELAPCCPVAEQHCPPVAEQRRSPITEQQEEETHAFGDKDDQ